MSRGMGRIQRRLLDSLPEQIKPVSTFEFAAIAYRLTPNAENVTVVTEAQLSAARRSLFRLAQAGLISSSRGFRDRRQRWATLEVWNAYYDQMEKAGLAGGIYGMRHGRAAFIQARLGDRKFKSSTKR
jgi:hypothetical protein